MIWQRCLVRITGNLRLSTIKTNMLSASDLDRQKILLRVIVVLIAVSIPSIIIGRTVIAIELGLALLCIPFLDQRNECWRRIQEALKGPLPVLAALTAVSWLPGLIVSPEPVKSFLTEFRTILYIFGGLALWSVLSLHVRHLEHCLRALLLTTAVLATLSIAGLFGPEELIGLLRGFGWAKVDAARLLKESAYSASILIPIIVFAAFRLRGNWAALAVVLVVELLVLIYASHSRSAMAGLLSIALMLAILMSLKLKNWLLIGGCLAGFAILIVAICLYLQEIRSNLSIPPDAVETIIPFWLIDAPRQAIWTYSWHAGEFHRWFGVGINAMDKLPEARNWSTISGTRNIPLHPHNWILEIIVETGVVGFLLMLGTIIYATIDMVRNYLSCGEKSLIAALCVWAGYWAVCLFSISWWSSWWQVSFIAAMSICFAGRESLAPPDSVK